MDNELRGGERERSSKERKINREKEREITVEMVKHFFATKHTKRVFWFQF